MTESLVRDYYTTEVRKEWRRLVRDAYHRLEFATTLHFLEKYLPPHGRVLDAGGGPGRYTLELARRGYDVTLLDLTPANLAFARRQIRRAGLTSRVHHLIEGSIVDLSQFPDLTFDAVICLGGPLSHVVAPVRRARAIAELIRVAKPGAPLFVSVMGRFSLAVVGLTEFQAGIALPSFKQIRNTGDYPGGEGFTACHFFLPEELQKAFEAEGVGVLEMAGLEGLAAHHDKKLNQLAKDPQRWPIWLETHFLTCTHPAVVGMSEHMLIVCRKY
jgi:SAM-dependent methyltransferase